MSLNYHFNANNIAICSTMEVHIQGQFIKLT